MGKDVADWQERDVQNLGIYSFTYATLNDVLQIMPDAWPRWNKVELPGFVKKKQSCDNTAAPKTTLDFLVIFPTSKKFDVKDSRCISWIQKTTPEQ